MHPDMVKLLDLQEKDLALVEVDTRLAGILGEVEQLDKQLAEAERTLESRRRSAAEALRKRLESEAKIENFRRLVERQQARTDQLHGQREIQAAMVEMDLARSVLAKEENDWAQAGDNVIAQDAATLAAEKKLEEQRASQAEAAMKKTAKQISAHQAMGGIVECGLSIVEWVPTAGLRHSTIPSRQSTIPHQCLPGRSGSSSCSAFR